MSEQPTPTPAAGDSPPVEGRYAPVEREAGLPARVEVYDTTLRDGSQLEGISLTVDDKLRIAEALDELGVAWIEGGWPGANPKDDEFFRRAPSELTLTTSSLVAFGSTRRPLGKVDRDETLRHLLDADTATVCIVGKCWDYHVTEALRTTLDEGVAMVADSVRYLGDQGRRVMFDAEHFFDGYVRNPEYSLRVLEAAAEAGASHLVLCDTNGGSLPFQVERIVGDVVAHFGDDVVIGVHLHNDAGCGVANALAGVRAGARQVQGTINGYGERTGNCNLVTIVADLTLKMGVETLPPGRLDLLTDVSHRIAELVNITPNPQQPFVGASAFAHKAGLHVSAIARRPDAYEHVSPASVGNGTRFVVSELAGKSTLQLKAAQLGVDLDGAAVNRLIDSLKHLEHQGFQFEAADASLHLVMLRASGWHAQYFAVESFRVITEHRGNGRDLEAAGEPGEGVSGVAEVPSHYDLAAAPGEYATEATVKVHVGGRRVIATGEGNGPVNALDAALRGAIGDAYPELERIRLTDYKVRVLDTWKGTGAVTRVLIDTTDGKRTWTTIGVSENVIEASWQALLDAVIYGLLRADARVPAAAGEPAAEAPAGS